MCGLMLGAVYDRTGLRATKERRPQAAATRIKKKLDGRGEKLYNKYRCMLGI